jgi:hypothetical protein
MYKRSQQMNMKAVEGLLVRIWAEARGDYCPDNVKVGEIERAIAYCKQRQRSAKRRSAHFKFLADEQRELLR